MNSSLNRKKTDMFPYELTEDEDEERYRWVKRQKVLEESN
jgi:hypothetical protein